MVKKKALTDTGNFTKCWNIAGSFTAQKISVLLPLKYWLGVNREEYRPSGAAGQRSTASFRVQRIKQAHFWPAVLCYWMLQWARCLTLVANRHTRTHSQKHPMYPTVVVVILFIYCSETPTSGYVISWLSGLAEKNVGVFIKILPDVGPSSDTSTNHTQKKMVPLGFSYLNLSHSSLFAPHHLLSVHCEPEKVRNIKSKYSLSQLKHVNGWHPTKGEKWFW